MTEKQVQSSEMPKSKHDAKHQVDRLLASMVDAAVELAGYASYAEIVGCISHNRQDIRKWCDKIFALKRQIDGAG